METPEVSHSRMRGPGQEGRKWVTSGVPRVPKNDGAGRPQGAAKKWWIWCGKNFSLQRSIRVWCGSNMICMSTKAFSKNRNFEAGHDKPKVSKFSKIRIFKMLNISKKAQFSKFKNRQIKIFKKIKITNFVKFFRNFQIFNFPIFQFSKLFKLF